MCECIQGFTGDACEGEEVSSLAIHKLNLYPLKQRD